MTCLEAQDLMAGFVARAIPEAARETLQAHLGGCPSCRASAERLAAAWEFLGRLEPPPVPLDLAARLRAAEGKLPATLPVPKPPPAPRFSFLLLRLGWRPAAALAVLALAAGFWLTQRRFAPRPRPPLPSAPVAPLPSAPPPLSWSHAGAGTLRLLAVPAAAVWAAPGSRGAVDEREGRLLLESGVVWGRPQEGAMLRLEAAGWKATVTRGTFTASASGGVVALTCHEGFLRVEAGPGFAGPSAVPEGTSVLLLPGQPPVGPRPARALYPGEPAGP